MKGSFTAAWMADQPAALALLPRAYRDPARRREAATRAATRRIDPQVLAHLDAHTPAQLRQRDLLAAGGACCLVTGQQAGLFGGPLYTIYKTAAVIADARALTAESGVPCVPVFWLQNEDHDYAEIGTCTVPDDTELRRITVPGRPDEVDRAIAARRFPAEVDAAVDALDGVLLGPGRDAVIALLRDCYRPDVSPSAAFRRLMEALFAEHGLLIVDPARPALRAAAAPVHAKAIADAVPIAEALRARSAALEAAGFAVQVHVRPDAPLSFLHPDGFAGPRARFEPTGDGYRLCGTPRQITRAAALAGPHSTSALLRPILQDTWLPTAGYVGGPGEIAYLAQVPPLYAHFDLPVPLIIPRARFRVVDAKAERLLRQLGLGLDDLGADRPTLLKAVGRADEGMAPDALAAALLDPITAALDAFAPHAAFDKGLSKATRKTRESLTAVATRLVDRYRRTLARDDETTLARLERVRVRVQPGGAPQERVHCWPWYGAQYGVQGFVDLILAATVPFDGSLQTVRP